MIATIETGSPNVVGLKLTGKLHDEDYKQFVQTMQTILSVERNVRLFVQYEDFPGWDLYAAWEELTVGLMHYSNFERIAMVGDSKWEKWMADFCKPFPKAKVKYFDTSEVDAAWKWLKDTDEENRATEEKDRTLDVAGGPGMWNDFPGFGV